jgi:hypothetical protein
MEFVSKVFTAKKEDRWIYNKQELVVYLYREKVRVIEEIS